MVYDRFQIDTLPATALMKEQAQKAFYFARDLLLNRCGCFFPAASGLPESPQKKKPASPQFDVVHRRWCGTTNTALGCVILETWMRS